MGVGELNNQAAQQERLVRTWRKRHPYVFVLGLGWAFIWVAGELQRSWSVVFAQWPSMQNPVDRLLNASDKEEADRLTDKWAKGKLKELNYVGISVCRRLPCDSSINLRKKIELIFGSRAPSSLAPSPPPSRGITSVPIRGAPRSVG